MRLSGLKSEERQGLLFEQPLSGYARARNVVGEVAEELTAALVGGKRHRTDSRADYCPDVSDPLGNYYESKGTNSGQTFVYAGRLERDRAFVLGGLSLAYVVWSHRARSESAGTVEGLQRLVLKTVRAAYLVPFAAFDAVCSSLPIEALNSKYGNHAGNRRIYGSGYRVPLKMLVEYAVPHSEIRRAIEGVVSRFPELAHGDLFDLL